MKKVVISITIFLWLVLFLPSYKDFKFDAHSIWTIERQRTEHIYLFPSVARFIHNKGLYFSYTVLENYLSYYSPSIFFCCNQPLILELITLITFYGGIFIILGRKLKLAKIVLFWTLVYPIFPALMLWTPSFLLLLPLIIPPSGILLYRLYKFKLH